MLIRIISIAAILLMFNFAQVKTHMNSSEWNKRVDEFFDGYYQINPTAGTYAGFHQYDERLEDYSQAGVKQQAAWMKEWLERLSRPDYGNLSATEQMDAELLINRLKSELMQIDDIRVWEKNPDYYSSGISQSAFSIVARSFASPEKRMASLTAREKLMPAALQSARENLKNPPRVFTEVAIEQMPGIIEFFQRDVPDALKNAKGPQLRAEFTRVNEAVISALRQYQEFLQKDLLPVSKGDFRIGAETYRKKLEYDEMVDLPLERLLQIGYEDLHRNQQEFKRIAARLNPRKTPEQMLADLQKDHPEPEQLMKTFEVRLKEIRGFIEKHQIVTIPSPVPPILEESPPFMRALTFASMDTPGPYEKVAKEAFFNVTLPESSWSKERIDSFMGQFNYATIVSTAIHEVYPGHYVQFLWVPSAPSKIRKLIGCGSNSEGWAHYSEQMLLDEGYGDHDPTLRLGQLQDALLRNARYIVGISMHTGKMTFEQGIEFFVKEGYQPKAVALVETRRGTGDPTYLVYTLGKLEILKLREDYGKKMGSKFSLREFHDTFLRQGFPPIRVIRKTILGDAGPVL